MANNVRVHAAVIEEEPSHEIYANLIERSSASQYPDKIQCRRRTSVVSNTAGMAAAIPTAVSNDSNPIGSHANRGAALIPTEDLSSDASSSQFINFYRKSCQTQRRMSTAADAASKAPAHKSKSEKTKRAKDMRQHATKACSSTKSERKRLAKRERDRQVQKDKRIRMMLRSDFSEMDDVLYRGLIR